MRLLSLVTLSTALFVSLNLTGCVPPPSPGPHPGPPAGPSVNYYQKGYNDGCWTKRHAGVRKNQYLYNHYYSYRNGWHKGYNTCKPKVKPLPGPIKPKPVPVPVPKPKPVVVPKPKPPVAPKPIPPKPKPVPMPIPKP